MAKKRVTKFVRKSLFPKQYNGYRCVCAGVAGATERDHKSGTNDRLHHSRTNGFRGRPLSQGVRSPQPITVGAGRQTRDGGQCARDNCQQSDAVFWRRTIWQNWHGELYGQWPRRRWRSMPGQWTAICARDKQRTKGQIARWNRRRHGELYWCVGKSFGASFTDDQARGIRTNQNGRRNQEENLPSTVHFEETGYGGNARQNGYAEWRIDIARNTAARSASSAVAVTATPSLQCQTVCRCR